MMLPHFSWLKRGVRCLDQASPCSQLEFNVQIPVGAHWVVLKPPNQSAFVT